MEYKRNIFKALQKHLDKQEITLITGARQVGKTTVMEQLESELIQKDNKTLFLTLEDKNILTLLDDHPKNILQLLPPGDESDTQYVFIDEIQYLKDPSNFLKLIYDLYKKKIKLIVSGSSAFYIDTKFKDSLAGRKQIFTMFTLSFSEMLKFRGKESLIRSLTGGDNILYQQEIKALMGEYIIYGGYPDVILAKSAEEKKNKLKDIAQSYVKKDALEADIHHVDAYMKLISLLSAQIGALVNATSLGNALGLNALTIQKYLMIMRKSYHLSMITPFGNNKTKELTKMPKIYFYDTGLRNYFTGNFSSLPIRSDVGELFENFVFRLLVDKYNEDDIHFCRTPKKQEVDFVVREAEERSHAFEVKYSQTKIRKNQYAFFSALHSKIPLTIINPENVFKILLNTESVP